MQGEDLYLPTAPNKLVKGIKIDSGIPLQSAAKVPIMITFNVVDRDGNHNDVKPQACIFKVILCTHIYISQVGRSENCSLVTSPIYFINFFCSANVVWRTLPHNVISRFIYAAH